MDQSLSSSRHTRAPHPTGSLRISELAEAVGTSTRALRHYEDVGLIRPDRAQGQARIYGRFAQQRARMIVSLRKLGLSLPQIEATLADDGSATDRAALKRLLIDRLSELDATRALVADTLGSLDSQSFRSCRSDAYARRNSTPRDDGKDTRGPSL